MNKGVSVIIPCHYSWLYVKECLDSLFAQRGVDMEVICVCNSPYGDHADLYDKLQEYQATHKFRENQYLAIFCNERHGKIGNFGAASARNLGLKIATKETVMFVDDDDMIGKKPGQAKIDPYYLKAFYDNLMLNQKDKSDESETKVPKKSGIAMAVGNVIKEKIFDRLPIMAEREIKRTFSNYTFLPEQKTRNYDNELAFLHGRNSSCGILYRTEIIRKYRLKFAENMRYHEDTDFVMRYALAAIDADYKHILIPIQPPITRKLSLPELSDQKKLGSFYWYRNNTDSVMGRIDQNSAEKWKNIPKQLKDTLYYLASTMGQIEHNPKFAESIKSKKGTASNTYKILAETFRQIIATIQNRLAEIEKEEELALDSKEAKPALTELCKFKLRPECVGCEILHKKENACHGPDCPLNGSGGTGGGDGSNGDSGGSGFSLPRLASIVDADATFDSFEPQTKAEMFNHAKAHLRMLTQLSSIRNPPAVRNCSQAAHELATLLTNATSDDLIEIQNAVALLLKARNQRSK